MSNEMKYPSRDVHNLSMAGLGKNIGYGGNKVFTAAILQNFSLSTSTIGLILALEGLFGLVLNPAMGWVSDHTAHPNWRRKPYVLIGLPAGAICWYLFFLHTGHAWWPILMIALFYICQQGVSSPYYAWMSDIVPSAYWSRASSVLNVWWEIGNLIAFLFVPLVYEALGIIPAAVLTSALMLGTGLWTGLLVPATRIDFSAAAPPKVDHVRPNLLVKPAFALFYLGQLFAWLAFESIASFFTLLIEHTAHGTEFDSAIGMSIFTITGLVGAVLTGRIYNRFGARRLIGVSMLVFGVVSLSAFLVHAVSTIYILVLFVGIFWGINLTASFTYVGELLRTELHSDNDEVHYRATAYGLYNIVQSIGLLVAAPIGGFVISLCGNNYPTVTFVTLVAGALAFVVMMIAERRMYF